MTDAATHLWTPSAESAWQPQNETISPDLNPRILGLVLDTLREASERISHFDSFNLKVIDAIEDIDEILSLVDDDILDAITMLTDPKGF